jgi:hypothetical protein
MGDKIPGIKSIGQVPALSSLGQQKSILNTRSFIGDEYLYSSVPNFYFTCSVTKASSTMAKCVELFTADPVSDATLISATTGK